MKWCLLISCLLAGCASAPAPQPRVHIAPPPVIPSQCPASRKLELLGWSEISDVYLEVAPGAQEHARLERALATVDELEKVIREEKLAHPGNLAQEGGLKR